MKLKIETWLEIARHYQFKYLRFYYTVNTRGGVTHYSLVTAIVLT